MVLAKVNNYQRLYLIKNAGHCSGIFFGFQAQRYNHSTQLRARKMRDFFCFKIERYKFNYILRAQQS
jgi:hypothetical protein